MAGVASGEGTRRDRKSTRLNSSHTEIYTLSLHDALPISIASCDLPTSAAAGPSTPSAFIRPNGRRCKRRGNSARSEEHTSELQSHRDLHSFPTRRSSDLYSFVRFTDERRSGAFYPFCIYSPEWQALQAARELG